MYSQNLIFDTKTFITSIEKIVRFSKCIYYLLGKKSIEYTMLNKDEKNFLSGFYDDNYVVEESCGFIKGDKVIIISGPLIGKESIIKRINRHKRIAEVEVNFMGDIRKVKVELEIISKT